MLLNPTEMHVELMEVLKQRTQGRAFGHLGEGVHILGEALAAVAQLAVGAGHVGVRVVDVAREEDASVHLAPVGPHLLAVFAAGVEVGDLVGPEQVVHILGELGLERGHHRELLADEDLDEQLVGSGEHHGLLLEVLDMGALGEELGHVAHLVARFAREAVAGAGQDGGAHEDGHVGEFLDELGHEAEVLRAVVLGGDVDLQEGDVHLAQVVVITLGRVADKELALGVVVFQPVFEGSTHEAASDDTYVDHFAYTNNYYFIANILTYTYAICCSISVTSYLLRPPVILLWQHSNSNRAV